MEETSLHGFSQQTVPRTMKHGTPTDEELEKLGVKIVENWIKLGRRLGVSDPQIEEIKKAHDQLSEKGYLMLKHWKQERGSAATYKALCDGLQHELVQRQDLAEMFCYISVPADPVPEGRLTGEVSGATASTRNSGDSTGVRTAMKRKSLDPDPERGVFSWKMHCVSATSKNTEKQDPQVEREKVNRYMAQKVDEAKGKFDLSSYTGLRDLYVYLVGERHLMDVGFEISSIKITVKCPTLEILEGLWRDYCSGRLNAEAEKCLITEKVKDELGMETIKLVTTMLEEDYFACKLSLMAISDIRLKKVGPEYTDVANRYSNLGVVQRDMGNLQQAKEYHERALDIRLITLGFEHTDVANTYNNLGVVQRGMGNLQQAKVYHERALDIILKKPGPEHFDVKRAYSGLRLALCALEALQEAKRV